MAQINNNIKDINNQNEQIIQNNQQLLKVNNINDVNKSIFVTDENYKTKLINDNEMNKEICFIDSHTRNKIVLNVKNILNQMDNINNESIEHEDQKEQEPLQQIHIIPQQLYDKYKLKYKLPFKIWYICTHKTKDGKPCGVYYTLIKYREEIVSTKHKCKGLFTINYIK